MAVSRVVNKKHLQPWLKDDKASRTFTTPETVFKIIEEITKENVELGYETNSAGYVFIRLETVVRDKQRVMPWSEAGGALTQQNPITQLGTMTYNIVKNVPCASDRQASGGTYTVSVENLGNYTTLTITHSCEI